MTTIWKYIGVGLISFTVTITSLHFMLKDLYPSTPSKEELRTRTVRARNANMVCPIIHVKPADCIDFTNIIDHELFSKTPDESLNKFRRECSERKYSFETCNSFISYTIDVSYTGLLE